jgi:hypothetical protein
VTVARARASDARHALVTAAVTAAARTRYLTIPVTRDGRGGLVVEDLPSFSAPPRRASLGPVTLASVTGSEQGVLVEVVSRFMRSYLAGDASGLEYLVPAGVRIAAPPARSYELVDLVSLAHASPPSSRVRALLASVRVRELDSGGVFAQRFRLRLERRERWYVADVNSSREG